MKISQVLIGLIFFMPLTVFAESQKILITELMAINSNNITDEDGNHSDWIEIYNNTDEDINLSGWFLSDKDDNLSKWEFPEITIGKGNYLVIFASEKNRRIPGSNMHTNFKLSGSGEFLAVCEPDSTISHAYFPAYPSQRQDISFGLYLDQYVFFTKATPGAANQAGNQPFAPNFSVSRGIFENPFSVTLTVPNNDGKIYYTTNGTRPTKENSSEYTAPVSITKNTPLSAVTLNSEGVYSEIITHTYLFADQIINQPANPEGYPLDWKQEKSTTSIKSDYEMDKRITTSAVYKNLLEQALKTIPSMAIVTNVGYLFSNKEDAANGGIYIYTGRPSAVGTDWVRPTSVEYFDPATGKEFQLNCRLKLHGGNSRNPGNSPKHGFELTFKSEYGPSKLNFNLFDEKKSANEFNSVILRAGYNYTWVKNAVTQQTKAQYLQDSWTKTTQLAMGQPSAHEKFVHLYINGLYWGMYNISEEYDKDFMESYLGGDETEYDVIKEQQNVADGTTTSWNALKTQIINVESNTNYQKIQGKNPDGTDNPSFQNLLEVENYIDYMLINYYIGNGDWDKNNWTVARNRVKNNAGFRFFCWDAETSMLSLTENKVSASVTAGNPTAFMQYLKKNSDFKITIADRIKNHLIDTDGALTPAVIAERYEKLTQEIELAIICESTRWSDWFAPYNPYTLNDHWLPRKNELMTNYFPQRTDVLLDQLKSAGLYPSVEAPVFTHQGGNILSAVELGMTAKTGTIYYTTDGIDPRASISGNISSSAKTYNLPLSIGSSTTVKARAKTSTEWSAITQAVFMLVEPNAVETPLAEMLACINYPNPFVHSTRVQLNIPYEGELQLNIYSIDGRLVKQLFNGRINSGTQNFEWQAENEAPGVYICKISFNNTAAYLKMIKN